MPPIDVRAQCPTQRLMASVGDTWSIHVIIALQAGGTVRHGELMRAIDGVTQKMLTQTLRRLEVSGFVGRDVKPTRPVSVYYYLTDMGTSLYGVLAPLRDWAETNVAFARH